MRWRLAALALLASLLPVVAKAADPLREMRCLAQAVYWEARGQPFNAQVAVAQVVINRAEDGRFGNTLCAVVYQRNAGTCQFTWVCTNAARRPRDQRAWEIANYAAYLAVFDHPDLVEGAIFFHDTSVRRWPHLERTARIGNIIFYRER